MIQGSFCASPIAFAISLHRFVCSIQKSRMALSGFERVREPDFGCENDDELKSSFMPCSFAQSIQDWKYSTVTSSRSTAFPLKSPYISCRLRRCVPGMRLLALSMSSLSSSMSRAAPGKLPVDCIPPDISPACTSNPFTSSACQQCSERWKSCSCFNTFSVSTPISAKRSFAT